MSHGADDTGSHTVPPPAGGPKRGAAEGSATRRMLLRLVADQVVLADLALPEVLQRIVIAGRELTRARYGALGVIGPKGLDQFVDSGLDEETAARIGRLPEGRSLLGAMIADPGPLWVSDIADDPRSTGSFLGVPIRVRDEVYGNLYLAESEYGEFSTEDEEMARALGITAGVAIENAHLYAEAQHRQEWLHAAAEVTRQLLSSDGDDPLRLIACQAQRLADADAATVVLPTADRQALNVAVACGEGTAGLESRTFPIHNTFAGLVVESAQPILIEEGEHGDERRILMAEQLPIGPIMLLPLRGSHGVRGALTVGRLRGRPRFTEADLDMANVFANHAAVALELASAREDQQRMLLLEDRDLLAHDLHDHVIQRLFATGLTVQSVSAGLRGGEAQERLAGVVTEFDDAIRQIRSSIFELGGLSRPTTGTVQARLLGVAAEVSPLLGFEPEVRFAGPLDTLVAEPVVEDMVAVLREALTNTARHAGASAVVIEVVATDAEVDMHIIDDGVGIGHTTRRSGLANLSQRATRHRGELSITNAPVARSRPGRAGTAVRFTIPL